MSGDTLPAYSPRDVSAMTGILREHRRADLTEVAALLRRALDLLRLEPDDLPAACGAKTAVKIARDCVALVIRSLDDPPYSPDQRRHKPART